MSTHAHSHYRAAFDQRAASSFLKAAFQAELAARPDVYKPAQGAWSGQWGAPQGGIMADSKTDFLSALSAAYTKAGGGPPQAGCVGAGWYGK